MVSESVEPSFMTWPFRMMSTIGFGDVPLTCFVFWNQRERFCAFTLLGQISAFIVLAVDEWGTCYAGKVSELGWLCEIRQAYSSRQLQIIKPWEGTVFFFPKQSVENQVRAYPPVIKRDNGKSHIFK